jgi:hypothetical protein
MILKNKLHLPKEVILNSKNIDVIRSSFTKRPIYTHESFIKKYYKKFKRKLFRLFKRIKYYIISGKIGALLEKNLDLWYAQHSLMKKHQDIVRVQLKMRIKSILIGDYQFERLHEIDKLIKAFRPKSIMEYGSGTSSAIFAKLAGNETYFQTTDEMKEWVEKLFASLPNDLKPKINMVLAKTKIDKVDSELVISYETTHDRYFDFVYVDGPYNNGLKILPPEMLSEVKDPHGKHLPNYDSELLWENSIYPKFIVIDGRRSTIRRLILKGAKHYRIYLKSDYSKILNKDVDYYLYHTILIRKDVIL